MKRISTALVAAAATAALVLSGCSSEEEPAEASGLRKNTATAQKSPETGTDTTDEPAAPGEDSEAAEEPASPAESETAPEDAPLPDRASDTTCAQFKALDEPDQQALVGRILAENPDSAFADNPNAALGTAKLVCNSSKVAEQKVAVVSGIVING
ncbi:hypothetical protein [Nocardia sp. X0981]